jgi:DNA-binding NarL/FixJ family response regulator
LTRALIVAIGDAVASPDAHLWLVEDNLAFRLGTERALVRQPGIRAVRAFGRCEDALVAIEEGGRPDVVLMDVGLPGMDGIEGIRRIKALAPETAILVLTVFEDDDRIFRAICAGACGYLLKGDSGRAVVEAVGEALAGGAPMNPRIARRVLGMFARLNTVPARADYGLTERERSVLSLMVDGRAKKQIADELALNQHTVDYAMRCIYRKLHVNCLASAVSLAVKDGLVPGTPPRQAGE